MPETCICGQLGGVSRGCHSCVSIILQREEQSLLFPRSVQLLTSMWIGSRKRSQISNIPFVNFDGGQRFCANRALSSFTGSRNFLQQRQSQPRSSPCSNSP